jgi:hypothetical protein
MERDIDILFLVETWLGSEEYAIIQELTPNGYSFMNFARDSEHHGGGIGVLYKSSIKLTITSTQWDTKFFEHCCVKDSQTGLCFICVYRPFPSTVNKFRTSDFLEEFDNFINDITTLPNKIIILGDFNIHVNKPEKPEVRHYQNSLSSAGFHQYITVPTHISGNTLDHLMTRVDDDIIVNYWVEDNAVSDHFVVKCTIRCKKPTPKKVSCTRRDFRTIDGQAFAQDLNNAVCDISDSIVDVNDLVDQFSTSCVTLLDKCAPFKTRTRSTRCRLPWFDEDIFKARRVRRQYERKWRKSKSENDRTCYRNQLQVVIFIHSFFHLFISIII